MNAVTVIAILITVAIIFLAARDIYKEKKKGTKCIGCPLCKDGDCPKHGEHQH